MCVFDDAESPECSSILCGLEGTWKMRGTTRFGRLGETNELGMLFLSLETEIIVNPNFYCEKFGFTISGFGLRIIDTSSK